MVLAAGSGRRFGSAKQLAEVDADGAALLDYTIFDARRAGFGDVLVVVRPELEMELRAHLADRYGDRLTVGFVHQQVPLGTGHALLCAASHLDRLDRPFAVANGDDFYGAGAWARIHDHLSRRRAERPESVLISYTLRDTLSASGGVSRAICEVDESGLLRGVSELLEVRHGDGEIRGRTVAGPSIVLTGDEAVSMNLWGFGPEVFPALRAAFERFRAASARPEAEFRLSEATNEMVRRGETRVRVVPVGARWLGLTHAGDLPRVRAGIAALVADGEYPARLDPRSADAVAREAEPCN